MDWRDLAEALAHAARMLQELDTLQEIGKGRDGDGEFDESHWVFAQPTYLRFPHLSMGLAATRPWGETEPADVGVTDGDQEWYLTALAVAFSAGWKVRKAAARHGINKVVAEEGWHRDEVKIEYMKRAILLVQSKRDEPTPIKRGSHGPWYKDETGTKEPKSPHTEIPHIEYLLWFRAHVFAIAEQLAMEASPEAEGKAYHGPPEEESPLAILEAKSSLDAIRAVASPGQRDMLDALVAALASGADMTEARRAACDELGWRPSTLRVQLKRLRDKIDTMDEPSSEEI